MEVSNTIIYGVFNNDGYECSDLCGLYDNEEKAEAVRKQLEDTARLKYEKSLFFKETQIPFSGSAVVEPLLLNSLVNSCYV